MKVRVKTLEEILNLDSVEKVKVDSNCRIQEIKFKDGVVLDNVSTFCFGEIVNVVEIDYLLFDYAGGKNVFKKEWVELIDDSCGPKIKEMSIFELAQAICYHAEAIKQAIEEGDDV